MLIAIEHELRFTPPEGTGNAVLHLLLTPKSGPTQKVLSWSVEMPGIEEAGRFIDACGNDVHLVNQTRPEEPMTILVKGMIETTDKHGVLGRPPGEPVPTLFKRITPLTKPTAAMRFKGGKDTTLETLHSLMTRVGEVLGTDETPVVQEQMQASVGQSQSQSQGQSAEAEALPPASDYAHTFIGAARALDIPVRYVTGYLHDAEEGVSPFHAWAEAYDEKLGWIGFDPRLQICATERHVRLAIGLDALGAQGVRTSPEGDGVETVRISVEQREQAAR